MIANSKIEKNAEIFIKLQYSDLFSSISSMTCLKLLTALNYFFADMKQITEKQFTESSASNCTVIVSLNGNELHLN